jgi:zona occludens toxin
MLITATPGGGKTALAVQIMQEAIEAGRPLFVMGIPDLQLPHSPCPPIAEWTESRQDPDNPELSLPFFTFPPNSLIVLDEAQRVFRMRASASKVPDHVAAFETVRHTGVTFVLITQHPNFIDTHIRNLVGQHVHLRDLGLLGRHYYEWPEAADPKQFTTAPIKKRWKLPKSSFALYKSASVHIKRNYSVPPALMVLAFSLLFVLGVGFYLYGSIQKKITPALPEKELTASAPGQSPATLTPAGNTSADPASMLVEFVPAVPGRPETAPAFDTLRMVKQMPVVVGCIQLSNSCTCLNQQGLDAGLDSLQCKAWLKHPPFNPYTDPATVAGATAKDALAHPKQSQQLAPSPEFVLNPPPAPQTPA